MRIAFVGTPEIAVPVLRAVCAAGHDVVAVITAPDRPAGRGYSIAAPPVKQEARHLGLPVYQPENINAPDFVTVLDALTPEAIAVMAYGRKLRRAVLAAPNHGCLNVHPSLLPAYRGAAPAAWALIHGETETGVTVFRMTGRMDAGDILVQERVAIAPDETTGELNARLAVIGARLMVAALAQLHAGTAAFRSQDEAAVSLAPSLRKEDGLVDWARSAAAVRNHVRAMQPWPGAFTFHHPAAGGDAARRVLLLRVAAVEEGAADAAPGLVLKADGDTLRVAAGDGAVDLLELKPAGKRIMAADAFVRGYHVRPGDRFGGEA